MTSPRPTPRRRRPLIDLRLVVGVAFVLVSVAGVTALVQATDHRVTVYVADRTFAPGDRIRSDDLLARQVTLDDARPLYLGTGDLPDEGLVATAVVRRGELVPVASVSTTSGNRSTALVLSMAGQVSESVVAGALVDVWSSPSTTGDGEVGSFGGFGPPTVLTSDAVVVRVVEPDGIVSAGDGQSVEVLVPRSRIARVLQAIANGDALAVVPAGIPLSAG